MKIEENKKTVKTIISDVLESYLFEPISGDVMQLIETDITSQLVEKCDWDLVFEVEVNEIGGELFANVEIVNENVKLVGYINTDEDDDNSIAYDKAMNII